MVEKENQLGGELLNISELHNDLKGKDIVEDLKKQVNGESLITVFTGAELEILNVLFHSDKPVSYERVAKIVGKKEKSIRNLIYEIRRKGIDVLTKPIGIRQKGFYLPAEEKIKVSGR